MAPKTTAEYLSELGRAQTAFNTDYKNRPDLQQGANTYANKLRDQAKASGIDLSGYGTQNQYGTDYTQYFKGGTAGAYDPSKAGQALANPNQSTTSTAPATGGGTGGFDIAGMYNNMYASQLQKLRDIKEQQLAGLAGQENVIGQNRIGALNNNDAMAAQQLRAMREGQANAGVTGGDSVTAQIANQTAQGQNANSIEQNSGNQLKQLMAMRDQINNSSSADELALLQGIQAQQGQAQLGQFNTDRQFGLSEGGLLGSYNGLRTLQGQQFDNQQAQQNWNNNFQQGQFTYQQARDQIKDQQYKQQFDEDVRRYGQDYAIKQAQLNNQLSNANADNTRQQTTADFNQFMDVWKANGKAPYDFTVNGQVIKANTPYAGYASSVNGNGTTPIGAKDSADNYSLLKQDLKSTGLTRDRANQLVEANKVYLTDTDYRDLKKYIDENF